MDLSSHGNTQPFRQKLTHECPVMIGTVPVYDSVIHYQRDLDTLTAKDFIDVIRLHAEDGVDFVTLHCGITRKTIDQIRKHKRKMNIVSRGGSLVFAWMCMTGNENPFYEHFDEILDICEEHDVTISLGDACRPGCLADATDVTEVVVSDSRKAMAYASANYYDNPSRAFSLVGITGTNGKTTTTSLTDYLLKAAGEASVAVGNIGEPPVNEIDGRAHNEWFVAELSSYQIATTTELHPRVAVLLNITPDHLGWHKSHKNYALAKIKLFDNMVDDDLAVVDVEDAGIHEFDEYIYTPGRRICKVAFDEPEGEDAAFVRDGKMIVRLKGVETPLIATSELKISGHHNVINALCAATAALAVGADVDGVCRGLASFQPLEHRVEPCGEIDGVRYVNDSKATKHRMAVRRH